MARWLLYGANGFTGRLIAQEALRRGHQPVLAGRSASQIEPLADSLGLEARVFGLDPLDTLTRAIRDVDLVLHAAGPFLYTAEPMMRACVLAGVHYLDISGEIPVFEGSLAYDEAARRGGFALICGVGFDVVPTNCLAQYVAAQVPEATRLEIAIHGLTRISTGTARSAIVGGSSGGWVRREGKLVPYPLGLGARRLNFPDGQQTAMPFPWGDLSASYRSTGIGNIVTYSVFPAYMPLLARLGAPIAQALLTLAPVRAILHPIARARFKGPDATQLNESRAYVWAKALEAGGEGVEAWIETPEPYQFTALAGVQAVEQTLALTPTGALAPAQAFGTDFPLGIEGVTRLDTLADRGV
ncbi:MAG: saccharopine dehydrogenase NADP-binding domain-containing protein [Anaerolineae bacterium]|nr:saccharopine dehydrogenase NADP-binding domain-containing protein [Anaerolineae bacterium]